MIDFDFGWIITILVVVALAYAAYKLFSSSSGKSGSSSDGSSSGGSSKSSNQQPSMTEKDIRMIAKQTVMTELGEELSVLSPQIKKLENDVNELRKQQAPQSQDMKQNQTAQVDMLTKEAEKLKGKINNLNKNSSSKQ